MADYWKTLLEFVAMAEDSEALAVFGAIVVIIITAWHMTKTVREKDVAGVISEKSVKVEGSATIDLSEDVTGAKQIGIKAGNNVQIDENLYINFRHKLPKKPKDGPLYLTGPAHNSNFIGRDDSLARLRHIFNDYQFNTSASAFKKFPGVVIQGMNGVGKSFLVSTFLSSIKDSCWTKDKKKDWVHVLWIPAKTTRQIRDTFVTACEEQFEALPSDIRDENGNLKSDEVVMRAIYERLCETRCVIVFDDALCFEEGQYGMTEAIQPFLFNSGFKATYAPMYIVTTRTSSNTVWKSFEHVEELRPFSGSEALTFLKQRLTFRQSRFLVLTGKDDREDICTTFLEKQANERHRTNLLNRFIEQNTPTINEESMKVIRYSVESATSEGLVWPKFVQECETLFSGNDLAFIDEIRENDGSLKDEQVVLAAICSRLCQHRFLIVVETLSGESEVLELHTKIRQFVSNSRDADLFPPMTIVTTTTPISVVKHQFPISLEVKWSLKDKDEGMQFLAKNFTKYLGIQTEPTGKEEEDRNSELEKLIKFVCQNPLLLEYLARYIRLKIDIDGLDDSRQVYGDIGVEEFVKHAVFRPRRYDTDLAFVELYQRVDNFWSENLLLLDMAPGNELAVKILEEVAQRPCTEAGFSLEEIGQMFPEIPEQERQIQGSVHILRIFSLLSCREARYFIHPVLREDILRREGRFDAVIQNIVGYVERKLVDEQRGVEKLKNEISQVKRILEKMMEELKKREESAAKWKEDAKDRNEELNALQHDAVRRVVEPIHNSELKLEKTEDQLLVKLKEQVRQVLQVLINMEYELRSREETFEKNKDLVSRRRYA